MKHNKYFKTQLAACSAIAFISCYSPPRRDMSPRGDSIKSFVIACQKRRKKHK